MNKKFIYVIVLVVVVFGVIFIINNKNKPQAELDSGEVLISDLLNCSYTIDNQTITLEDGYSEEEVSGSKIVTRYFGNEVSGDFNNDGFSDTAFLLTQDPGGSGTFYYLAVALFNEDGCRGTNAMLLGDRISPQTTNFQDGKIIVNLAERGDDEPMTASPSIGVSRYFVVDGDSLVEVSQE